MSLAFTISAPFLEQWWLGRPQDDCSFGSVSNDDFRELYRKAGDLRGLSIWVGDSPSLARDIETLAPARSGIYHRIAATHAVMRANGLIVSGDHPGVALPQWQAPFHCDPGCGYLTAYVGPRIHGIKSLFLGASRKTFYVDFPLYTRPFGGDPWAKLKARSGRTIVSMFTLGLKGPGQDLVVTRGFSCPDVPPAAWAAGYDRTLLEFGPVDK